MKPRTSYAEYEAELDAERDRTRKALDAFHARERRVPRPKFRQLAIVFLFFFGLTLLLFFSMMGK